MKAGLKPSALQNILYGRSKKPSLHLLQCVARALGCRVTELIDEPGNDVCVQRNNLLNFENFNQDLYLSCFVMLQNILDREEKSLTREKILEIVEEIYLYSASNDLENPDNFFAQFLLKKEFK